MTHDAPRVSIIVPCYNEQGTIRLLLESLKAQVFPLNDMEIIIADGMSLDQTRLVITDFQQTYPELSIRVIDNVRKTIPTGLNRALEAAWGTYIVRLDAHSMPSPDYVQRCINDLESEFGVIVGGVWDIQPGDESFTARAIAFAASHPFAVGDARYRYTDRAGEVDTVPFGAYRKSLIDQIGLYDEKLLTNEDYEFATRARQAGGKVWLDPTIRSKYFARATHISLARQYWRYGYWKARMLRHYPETIRWRQALPPAFISSLFILAVFSIWFELARWAFFLSISLYTLVLIAVGLQVSWEKRDFGLLFGVPVAVATMHLSWGSGFLMSLIRQIVYKNDHS